MKAPNKYAEIVDAFINFKEESILNLKSKKEGRLLKLTHMGKRTLAVIDIRYKTITIFIGAVDKSSDLYIKILKPLKDRVYLRWEKGKMTIV